MNGKIKIHNTMTGIKEELSPTDGKINMFVCGPTVYDYVHIGNARTFVFFDVVAKYLRYKFGEDNISFIQNITDIDNKIIERAQKEGINPLEYARKYTEFFKEDMKALGVTSPEYKNATDHIPEVIKQVQALLDKGNAYIIENDGIYFDLSTFPDYGKLSGRTAGMADDAVSRIDDSDKKRNRGDFAIWKFSQADDPSWPAPFGDGRPGWHIEDTAITEKYFGPQYDLHGGGQDLIFPHHEAEIAQQESASGKKPFVKHWMHVAFLVSKSQKMSKSLGNFETANELLKQYPKEVLRFYLLSGHYRSPLLFDEKLIEASEAATQRLFELDWKLINLDLPIAQKSESPIKILGKYSALIEDALADDLNTPKVFGFIFELTKEVNRMIQSDEFSKSDAQEIKKYLSAIGRDILGIVPTEGFLVRAEIQRLVEEREEARQTKDFPKADNLREKIEKEGYQIDDTPYGPLIKRR